MKIANINLENNLILAPMLGLNCNAFRLLCKRHGCGLVSTAMIHPDSLFNEKHKLDIIEEEKPVLIQLVGKNPDDMAKAAQIVEPYADIIDINMGCPDQKVLANQSGAFLCKHPEQAEKMISEVVSSVNKPVTAKIRTGWDDKTINAVEVAKMLEDLGVAAIAVHGRTRKQGYTGKANWKIIREVKEAVNVPVIANGDVFEPRDYQRIMDKTGCDFVMIGRGAVGNPQIFENCLNYVKNKPLVYKDIKKVSELFDEFISYYRKYSVRDNFSEIRQHAMWIAKGIKNGAAIKNQLSKARDVDNIKNILEKNFTS